MKRKHMLVYGTVCVTVFTLYELNVWWVGFLHSQKEEQQLDTYQISEPYKTIYYVDDEEEEDIDEPKFEKQQHCPQPEMNIAFLKTHKTGGSTITSILNRFADINDLEIALPIGEFRFNWPYKFTSKSVDSTRLKNKHASILCNHLVFNRKEISKIMKKPYKLITILRDPVYQFRSLFFYHRMQIFYNMSFNSDPIQTFFNNTRKHYRKSNDNEFIYNSELLMKNGMLYDLNFREYKLKFKSHNIDDFIEYLDKSFHLVLITELFDEGLILLKRLMCWKFIDIVYEKKLVNKFIKKKNVSYFIKEKISKWSRLDYRLYIYFKNKMKKLIQEQKEDAFNEELDTFREINKLINKFCQHRTNALLENIIKYFNSINENPIKLLIKNPDNFCQKLHSAEGEYIEYFRGKFPPFYFL